MNQMERIETEIKRQTTRRSGWRRRTISATVIIAIAAAVAFAMMQTPTQRAALTSRFQRQSDQPIPTLATAARTADVPVYLEGVGTVKALNTVTVSAQVDGKLLNVYFIEGQDVERGFVLAQIDPTIYQAQYDQAVAKKAQDEATLANARIDLERYVRLAATNAGPKQQADTQRALVAQLEALVKVDQASIENQRAYLNYSKVVAPITGRTGMRLVDAGNIVQGSSGTPMVMITQLRPISIIFTLPQQKLGQVTKALAAGPVMVEAFGPDNKTVIDSGKLVVVDNQIDQTTGTIRLKGEFPNADLQLWPGQFCDVRILVDNLRNVVVVPNAAVQRGPNGPFVFVVGDDSRVAMRRVTVAQQDEVQAVIASGVQTGERVVTTSFNQLSEGKAVSIKGDGSGPPNTNEERPSRPPGQDSGGAAQSDRPRPPNTQRRTEREATSQTP
jgi:multidrug efflux system membrane fusion protein